MKKILFPWTKAKIMQKLSEESIRKTGQGIDFADLILKENDTVVCNLILEDGTVTQTIIKLPI